MKKWIPVFMTVLMIISSGCTVALNRSNWDSWIGRDWREFNEATSDKNCSGSGTTVICPKALGDLYWYVDGNGIIQTWEYKHRE